MPACLALGAPQLFRWRTAPEAFRRALCCLLLAVLAIIGSPLRAWDQDKMLAAAQRQGPRALAGARALQTVLAAAMGQDEETRLGSINQFFNRRIVFTDDMTVWGVPDYWASPLEVLEKGQGDCEDYAIAKYFSLVAAGTPVARLRLVYVRASVGGGAGVPAQALAHMVLAYYPAAGEPLILDNLVADVLPASRRPDLQPVFSFNGEGLWQGTGGQRVGDPLARLSRWRDVVDKAGAEGFP